MPNIVLCFKSFKEAEHSEVDDVADLDNLPHK